MNWPNSRSCFGHIFGASVPLGHRSGMRPCGQSEPSRREAVPFQLARPDNFMRQHDKRTGPPTRRPVLSPGMNEVICTNLDGFWRRASLEIVQHNFGSRNLNWPAGTSRNWSSDFSLSLSLSLELWLEHFVWLHSSRLRAEFAVLNSIQLRPFASLVVAVVVVVVVVVDGLLVHFVVIVGEALACNNYPS